MPGNGVCGIVVTFRPRPRDFENLEILRAQVEWLVVVDNGSPQQTLEGLRQEASRLGIVLIENGANLGIGAALNNGVKAAEKLGAVWVALFDQDSRVTDGFIGHLIEDFREISRQRNIQLIVPRYRDPETGVERVAALDADGGPFVTITSGSLLPIQVFQKVGYFNEELFIYTVDDEFSLRLRSKGFSIGESSHAVLLHVSGVPTYRKFLGKQFSTTNYRASVRYYISRNRVWMALHYGAKYPRWARGAIRASIIDLGKFLVGEEDRWRKLVMVGQGVIDGFLNRMGKTRNI